MERGSHSRIRTPEFSRYSLRRCAVEYNSERSKTASRHATLCTWTMWRVLHQCLITSRQINQVINVGSGIATNVLEIATRLTATLGSRPNIRVTAEYRLGDIRHNVADIDRLRTILEYEPRVGLTEGLERFAQWVLTQ